MAMTDQIQNKIFCTSTPRALLSHVVLLIRIEKVCVVSSNYIIILYRVNLCHIGFGAYKPHVTASF